MDLSIIIPTLNEARYIARTLKQIDSHKSGQYTLEIILVDAGSNDATVETTKPMVDILVENESLKGLKYKSLNEGASKASGDCLLFLDADSLVPDQFDHLIIGKLRSSEVVGGAFEFKMDEKGLVYRVIEWINRLRYRIDKRYFGDQGIFCTRKVFDKVKGFPEKPIMEAAYFCKALSKEGKLTLIGDQLTTSARRFKEGNPFRVFGKDAWIWMQYTLGLCVDRYGPKYWNENEKRN